MMKLIPEEVFDQHVILLGKTRSGKSSVARLCVENLLKRDEAVCVIDPKGDWWGLKSSADGKHAGFPVVIFGGEHGDVPLKANDPAKLRAKIAELQKQIRTAPAQKAQPAAADSKVIERGVREANQQAASQIVERDRAIKSLHETLAKISTEAGRAVNKLPQLKQFMPATTPAPVIQQFAQPRNEVARVIPGSSNGNSELTRPQNAILKAIAEFEAIGRESISKTWIAARSGASYTSSSYGNNLGFLRSGGYISYPGPDLVSLTDTGRAAAGVVSVPTSSEEMLKSCLALLSAPQQKILRELHSAHPNAISKDELAERVGASASSSSYGNNLGALRSAGMIEYPGAGTAKAADWLFL